ncbi:MAG: outer membrane lipoprotein-sorting protein [Nitrospirae bacterium]|nr:outer membrane lipoprotein-sorting protein [Nitrospirota bacterium]
MKRYILSILLILIITQSLALGLDEGITAQTVIARSDSVRNPDKPFQLNNRLTEYVDGSPRNEIILAVYSKVDETSGQFKNLVRYMEPPRDAGKTVLMNGSKMWFYDPASKASVRISPQQRLLGQASEGDVVTVNLARDYSAKLIGNTEGEALNDADHVQKKCWHLELSPINESAVYGRVEYWVEKETYRPIKGKFYSDSGRLLKIAYYHKYEEHLGCKRPSEIIIIDAVNSKLVTTMNTYGHKFKEIPNSWYQRDFLSRLNIE